MNLMRNTAPIHPEHINLLPIRPRLEQRFLLYLWSGIGVMVVAAALLTFASIQYSQGTERMEADMNQLRSQIAEARLQKEPAPATIFFTQLTGQSNALKAERLDWGSMWNRLTDAMPDMMNWKRADAESTADGRADIINMSFIARDADAVAAYLALLQSMDEVQSVQFQQWSGNTEQGTNVEPPLLEVDYIVTLRPRGMREATK